MTFVSQARAFFAVGSFDLDETVVDGAGEMGACSSGLAATDFSFVKYGDGASFGSQEIGRCEAGDSSADDGDVHVNRGIRRCLLVFGDVQVLKPKRLGEAIRTFHGDILTLPCASLGRQILMV